MKHEIWCPLEDMKKERLWYSVVVRDRQGKVVSRERRKAHSFLEQWNQFIYAHIRSVSAPTVHDTGGVARTVAIHDQDFRMNAAANVVAFGIVVGTGNTAVDIEDFQLETQIINGVAAGQMQHLICTIDDAVVAAPSCSFVVHRTIVNNSGGVITVLEAGIYMMGGPTPYYFCATRDVLVAPQAVPNGGAITIDWTIGVTE